MARHKPIVFISHDKGIKSFGQKHIDVKELPQIPPKPFTLFAELVG